MPSAHFGQVGVAQREEPVQCLGVEFGRETQQLLALGVRQEPNRHSENATLLTATLLWLVIALVSSPLMLGPAHPRRKG